MTDYKALLDLAKEGSSEAVYALFTNSFRHVYSVVHRICGSELISRRLAGETYAASFRNLDKLKDPGDYPAWMDRLASYAAQNYVKRIDPDAEFEDPAPDFSHDESGIPIEMMNTVWDDVNTLLSGRQPDYSRGAGADHRLAADEGTGEKYEWENDSDVWKLLADYGTRKTLRKTVTRYAVIFGATAFIVVFLLLINPGRADKHTFTFPNIYENLTDERIAEFADSLSGQLAGQIGEIYKIDDDTYYVVIYLNGDIAGGALVNYEGAGKGATLISESTELMSNEDLETVASDAYLDVRFTGESRSGAAASASARASETDADPEANGFRITDDIVSESVRKAEAEKEKLSGVLRLSDEETDFSLILRIMCRNVDLSKPVDITLDKTVAGMIGSAGELEVMLGDEQHSIKLSREQLSRLCGAYGTMRVRIWASASKTYDISFIDQNGDEIKELFGDMTFTLPAHSRMTYVFANYEGGSENRGGIYDEHNGTISFPVSLPGSYELIGNEVKITDMDACSREEKNAAAFMVSMGFMSASYGGAFDPAGMISRRDFLLILGRMFLATDDSLHGSLRDVDPGSPEYAYLISGMADSIIGGYGDGSFGGDNAVSRQEMISMCSRTLHHKGGAEYPVIDSIYLRFSDVSSLSEYAKDEVALAVKEGILDGGGELRPADAAVRSEAALMLYRMYKLLYKYND